MIIAVDESGSFVSTNTKNSWCVVAAYVFSERAKHRSYATLRKLKKTTGVLEYKEVKLRNISERDYFQFLSDLSKQNGVLFAVATDSYLNTHDVLVRHRTMQANKIRKNASKMIYDEGKNSILILSEEINSLSPQLYVQLQCQVMLFSDILHRAILYYVQRDPYTLRRYKWRIDQKNATKTTYERVFERILCPMLQNISFRKPMLFLKDADYSYMKSFFYSKDDVPEYVKNAYGKDLTPCVDIGKIIRSNLEFCDSEEDPAVQIADLLASGIRRCLRYKFSDNFLASKMIGKLMLSNIRGKYPIQLVDFIDKKEIVDDKIARVIDVFERTAKPMLINT